MRTVLASILLATAGLTACGDNEGIEPPDDTQVAPDATTPSLIEVAVRHTTSPVTETVTYWVHDIDGVLLEVRPAVNEPLQVFRVPENGSLTEVRITGSVQRRLRTVTGLTDGLTIDFEGRSRPLAGEVTVSVTGLPGGSRAAVGSSCGVSSLDSSDEATTLALHASPCQDARWFAVTVEQNRHFQVIDAPQVTAGGEVHFDQAWQLGAREELVIANLPATGSASFVRSLAVGRYTIATDVVQAVGAHGAVSASTLPTTGLHVIDSVAVNDGERDRLWSARDVAGRTRTLDLLPALDAPKIDDGLLQWYVPAGAEVAPIAVIEMSGEDLDPFHTSWKVIANAKTGELAMLEPAEGFPQPTGARVTLLEVEGVEASEAREAPFLVENLDWKAVGAATEHALVRTTSSWSN